MTGGWQFWIDGGGTFTDVIALAPDGALHTAKRLSAETAPLEGMRQILRAAGVDVARGLAACTVALGTTVATNALLERRGARVLLIANRGLADVFTIGTQERPDLFALRIAKPPPLHERALEAAGRVAADGVRLESPDDAALACALAEARAAGLEAVAAVSIHAHAHPADETRWAALARAAGFSHAVASHEIAPELGLLARGETAIADAYLTPLLRRYARALEAALPGARVRFMQSSGGLTDSRTFPRPGRAALGAGRGRGRGGARCPGGWRARGDRLRHGRHVDRRVAAPRRRGRSRLRDRGRRRSRSRADVAHPHGRGRRRLAVPLRRLSDEVGPESAGADPGPLCYDRRDAAGRPLGRELTLTDANHFLGRLPADAFRSRSCASPWSARSREPRGAGARGTRARPGGRCRRLHRGRQREHGGGDQRVSVRARRRSARRVRWSASAAPAGSMSARSRARSAFAACCCIRSPACCRRWASAAPTRAWTASATPVGCCSPEVACPARSRRSFASSKARRARRWHGKARRPRPPSASAGSTCATRAPRAASTSPRRTTVTGRAPSMPPTASVRLSAAGPSGRGTDGAGARPGARRGSASRSREPGRAAGAANGRDACTTRGFRVSAACAAPLLDRASLVPGQSIDGPAVLLEDTGTVVVRSGLLGAHRPGGSAGGRGSDGRGGRAGAADLERAGSGPARGHRATASWRSPSRWARSCGAPRTRPTSRSGSTSPARCSTPTAGWSRTRRTSPCTSARWARPCARCWPSGPMREGDVWSRNDPYKGGSHLPDLTVVTPVFRGRRARASSSPTAGITPTSAGRRRARCRPIRRRSPRRACCSASCWLVRGRCASTRTAARRGCGERAMAGARSATTTWPTCARRSRQPAGVRAAARAVRRVWARRGAAPTMRHVADNAGGPRTCARRSRGLAARRTFASRTRSTTARRIASSIAIVRRSPPARRGTARIDFTGTGAAASPATCNAPRAVAVAAVLYVFRTLAARPIPLNAGCLRPVHDRHAARLSLLDPQPPARRVRRQRRDHPAPRGRAARRARRALPRARAR